MLDRILSAGPAPGAQADILIEDGKIREVRPDIPVSAESTALIDASERIVIWRLEQYRRAADRIRWSRLHKR
jgi:hypothetical protein